MFPVWAATVFGETVPASDKQEEVFDIPSHLIMRLYRTPDKHSFITTSWYDNLNLSAYWAPDFLWEQAQYRFNAPSFGLALTKDYNAYSTWRLGVQYSSPEYDNPKYTPDQQGYKMKRLGVSLDYLWNMTSFYNGSDRSRRIHWLLSTGISVGIAQADENVKSITTDPANASTSLEGKKPYIGAHLGIQFRKTFSPRMSFFFEPRASLWTDEYDMGRNFQQFDFGLNALTGFSYRLTGETALISTGNDSARYSDNYFIQIGGGLTQAQDAQPLELMPSKGPGVNISLAVGRWLSPTFGVRLGVFENVFEYAVENKATRFTQMRGGRAELLVNPIQLLSDRIAIGRVGLDLSAGIESGLMKKHRGKSKDDYFNTPYFGVTAASQIKYFFNRNTALFAEGRLSSVGYAYEGSTLTDKILSGNLGIEIYQNFFNRYYGRNTQDSVALTNHNWFFELAGNISQPVHFGEGFPQFTSFGVSLGAGYHFDDFQSVRLRSEFIRLRGVGSHKGGAYKFITMLAPNYMFSLTNAWMGVNPYRHVDLRAILGPIVLLHNVSNVRDITFGWGGEAGLQLLNRINKNWELFAEPRFQVMNDYTNQWNLALGTSYTFDYVERIPQEKTETIRIKHPSKRKNWYMQVLFGGQAILVDVTNAELKNFQKPGSFALTFGRYTQPRILSVQGSIFKQRMNLDGIRTSQYFGGRLEGSFNIFHAFSPSLLDSRFDWTLSAGIEGGRLSGVSSDTYPNSESYDYNLGFTAASQLRYRILNRTWLLGELRVQQLSVGKINAPVLLQTGVQYDLYDPIRKDLNYIRNRWYAYGAAGLLNASGETLEAGAGINFNRMNGVRLYATVAKIDKSQSLMQRNRIAVSSDYIFNLSNAILGIDDSRIVDISLLGGVNLNMIGVGSAIKSGKLNRLFHLSSHVGFNAGTQVSAKMGEALSLYIEPRLNIQPYEAYPTSQGESKYNLITMAGLRVHFNPYKKAFNASADEYMEKRYLQITTLLQPALLINRKIDLKKNFGFGMELTYGRWFNRYLGYQNGFYFIGYENGNIKNNKTAILGLRPELIFNLSSAMNPVWADKPLSAVVSAGMELGNYRQNLKDEFKTAATAGGQLRYRLPIQTISLVAGARSSIYRLKNNYHFIPFSGELGIQLNMVKANSRQASDHTFADMDRNYIQLAYRCQPFLLHRNGIDPKAYAGNGIDLTCGQWLNRYWTGQIGIYYDKYRDEGKVALHAVGLRPEVGIDLFKVFNPYATDQALETVVTTGFEAGSVNYRNFRKFSLGYTAGGQLRYRFPSTPLGIVIGGRMSLVKKNDNKSVIHNRMAPVSGEAAIQYHFK